MPSDPRNIAPRPTAPCRRTVMRAGSLVRNATGGALLLAVLIGGAVSCGQTSNVSAGTEGTAVGVAGEGAPSPELTAQNDKVIGALNEQEKACVQAEPDVAKAAEGCVADATLGKSIAEIMGNTPWFTSMTDDDRKLINACMPEVLAALPAGSLGKLATQDKATMDAFGKAFDECLRRSQSGAAPSTTGPTIAQPTGTKARAANVPTPTPNTSTDTGTGNTPNNGVTSTSIAVPATTAPG